MLRISESFQPIDEELDFAKQGGGDSYRLWITGTKPETEFLYRKFIEPLRLQLGDFWLDKKYNTSPDRPKDASGKPLSIPPMKHIRQNDGSYAYFTWKSKNPDLLQTQLNAIQMLLRDANLAMAKAANPDNPEVESKVNPKLEAFLTKIEQVRDYLETTVLPTVDIPETHAVLEERLNKFIDDLSDAVSDADLIEKVNAYLGYASALQYSFFNTFLIYLQNPKASEVLAKGDWKKLNMQPKSPEYLMQKYPGAGAIGLWVPITRSRGNTAEMQAERRWRSMNNKPQLPPEATEDDMWYMKPTTRTKLTYHEKMTLDKFVRIHASQMKGGAWGKNMKVRFTHLDVEDVEQIPNTDVALRPQKPSWHSDEPDEKADHIYEIVVKVIQRLQLNFKEMEKMRGSSKGSSSAMGDINLLASNRGVGRASTAVHELAHALTHQDFLMKKFDVDQKVKRLEAMAQQGQRPSKEDMLTTEEVAIKNAYRGGSTLEEILTGNNGRVELQAEGSAFVVLRYYGIPADKLKHSAAYITLWRNNKDAVKANMDIIRSTAKGIVSLMNEEMGFATNTNIVKPPKVAGQVNDVEADEIDEEDDNLSFLYEMSIIGVGKAIDEIKAIKSNLLN